MWGRFACGPTEARVCLLAGIYLVLQRVFLREYHCVHIHDKIELWHVISNNVVCATSKASDQPAHTRSLIRAFASRANILGLLSY